MQLKEIALGTGLFFSQACSNDFDQEIQPPVEEAIPAPRDLTPKLISEAVRDKIGATSPTEARALGKLTVDQYTDTWMQIGTCYEFKVFNDALNDEAAKIRAKVFSPCLLEYMEGTLGMRPGLGLNDVAPTVAGVERLIPKESEYVRNLANGKVLLKEGLSFEIREGQPVLCSTPTLLGGLPPDEMSQAKKSDGLICEELPRSYELGNSHEGIYSFNNLLSLYVLSKISR